MIFQKIKIFYCETLQERTVIPHGLLSEARTNNRQSFPVSLQLIKVFHPMIQVEILVTVAGRCKHLSMWAATGVMYGLRNAGM